jgi:hypothetical protein
MYRSEKKVRNWYKEDTGYLYQPEIMVMKHENTEKRQ